MPWPSRPRALKALLADPMGAMGLVLVSLFVIMAVALLLVEIIEGAGRGYEEPRAGALAFIISRGRSRRFCGRRLRGELLKCGYVGYRFHFSYHCPLIFTYSLPRKIRVSWIVGAAAGLPAGLAAGAWAGALPPPTTDPNWPVCLLNDLTPLASVASTNSGGILTPCNVL